MKCYLVSMETLMLTRVLRTALWGETGLEREIISPTRESEVRKPASPKRTKLFKGI